MGRQNLKSYDSIAPYYNTLSALYSLGQISASKRHQNEFLQPNDRVLFLGCGSGQEVIAAAQRGCQVSALDASTKMLEKLARRLKRMSATARLVSGTVEDFCQDHLDAHTDRQLYDCVVANYFFNGFQESVMRRAIATIRPTSAPRWKIAPGGGGTTAGMAGSKTCESSLPTHGHASLLDIGPGYVAPQPSLRFCTKATRISRTNGTRFSDRQVGSCRVSIDRCR